MSERTASAVFAFKPLTLIFFSLTQLFECYLLFRQLRTIVNDSIPSEIKSIPEIKKIVDTQKKSKSYNSTKLKFQIFKNLFLLIVNFFFLNFDYYAILWIFTGRFF